jgi:aspartate-semialdehyde dehydrogenase
MSNQKSYGKIIKVHESTFKELKEIRDSEKRKSIDCVIVELIGEYQKSHTAEAQA